MYNNMQREKIKPIIDVPLVLQLETIFGEEAPSQYTGVEYRYKVVHEDRPALIYLPSEGRDAIQRSQAQPGDFIELVKQKRNGQILFSAMVCSDAMEPQEPPPPPPARVGYQPPPAPRRLPPPPPRQNGYTNGQGNGNAYGSQPRHQPRGWEEELEPSTPQPRSYHGQAQPPRPEAELHPITQQMAGCLRWSFDAWEELREYAESKGRTVDYTSEDIRATANTLFMRGTR